LKAKITKSIYISLIPLVSGVILACSSEIGFHPIGLSCALFSAIVFVGQNIFSKKVVFFSFFSLNFNTIFIQLFVFPFTYFLKFVF